MPLPKVLLIDDDTNLQIVFPMSLDGIAEVLGACSATEAWESFHKHPDVKIIVMDGFIPEATLGLTARIRAAGYSGPMVATSNMQGFCNKQLIAGCSHTCDKLDVRGLVEDWLTDPIKMKAAWIESGMKVLTSMGSGAKLDGGLGLALSGSV